MKTIKRLLALGFISSLILASPMGLSQRLQAGDFDELNGFGFSIGFPQAVGESTDLIEHGFGFDLNYNMQFPDSFLGLRFDGSYSGFQLTNGAVNTVPFATDGYVNIWGLGANVMLSPKSGKKVKPQLYAGPGFYYQSAYATRYGYSSGGGYCDPYWGCYTYGTSTTVDHEETGRLGYQGGASLKICFDNGGALLLDAQYVVINNAHGNLEYMPLNIGYEYRFD